MAFAKASNKALTQKVGALLLSIHNIIASLNFCTCISIMKVSGGVEMKKQKYHIYLTNQERSEIVVRTNKRPQHIVLIKLSILGGETK